MNSVAKSLWQQSDRYVASARVHLNPRDISAVPFITPYDGDEWLRISFLFPTLPEKSRIDLLAVRRFFLIAKAQQERERTDPNESAEYSEAMADAVAQQLKEALHTFSPVQRQILTTWYLILGEEETLSPE